MHARLLQTTRVLFISTHLRVNALMAKETKTLRGESRAPVSWKPMMTGTPKLPFFEEG